jgi:hypothetical protein
MVCGHFVRQARENTRCYKQLTHKYSDYLLRLQTKCQQFFTDIFGVGYNLIGAG